MRGDLDYDDMTLGEMRSCLEGEGTSRAMDALAMLNRALHIFDRLNFPDGSDLFCARPEPIILDNDPKIDPGFVGWVAVPALAFRYESKRPA